MPGGEIRGEGCVPDGVSFPGYGKKEPALFFGHYWLDPRALRLLWLQTSRVWTTAQDAAGRWSPIDSRARKS